MNRDEISAELEAAFPRGPKPEHFTDYNHCCECAEHDQTLRASDRDSIGLEQLGNPGWDPLCFVTAEGFRYYFPAMARLALDPALDGRYLDQFLFHLSYDGEDSRFFPHFSLPQRRAALNVLRYAEDTLASRIDELSLQNELQRAISLWTRLAAMP